MYREDLLDLLNDRDLSDKHPNRRPRKAASLIVWRKTGGTLKVLMGKRSSSLRFMPGKYVFPGGALERADTLLHPAQKLAKQTLDLLGKSGHGLAMAAVRECFEETGLRIAAKKAAPSRSELWKEYTAPGLRPDLSQLSFFARAVTPPRRIRRFDTFFFACEADARIDRQTLKPDTSEIEALQWISLKQAHTLDVAHMTRVILEEIKQNLVASKRARPFYRVMHGKFICSDIT